MDHVCREIRHGRLSRDKGQALVWAYDSEALQHAEKFCAWLGIERRSLEFILNQHRSQRHWYQESVGCWARTLPQARVNSDVTANLERMGYRAASELTNGGKDRYISIGKGYPI